MSAVHTSNVTSNDLRIGWTIEDSRRTNHNQKKSPTKRELTSLPKATPDITCNLIRINDEVIWVREGKVEHPAYLLQDRTSNTAAAAAADDTDIVWIEWLSNAKKECIYQYQIVKDGLQSRKRQRPNYFSNNIRRSLMSLNGS